MSGIIIISLCEYQAVRNSHVHVCDRSVTVHRSPMYGDVVPESEVNLASEMPQCSMH